MEIEGAQSVELLSEAGSELRQGALANMTSIASVPTSRLERSVDPMRSIPEISGQDEGEYFLGESSMETVSEQQRTHPILNSFLEFNVPTVVPDLTVKPFRNNITHHVRNFANCVRVAGIHGVNTAFKGESEISSSFLVKNNRRQNIKFDASVEVIYSAVQAD
jgi:hypothetical protein